MSFNVLHTLWEFRTCIYILNYIQKNCHQHSYEFQNLMSSWEVWTILGHIETLAPCGQDWSTPQYSTSPFPTRKTRKSRFFSNCASKPDYHQLEDTRKKLEVSWAAPSFPISHIPTPPQLEKLEFFQIAPLYPIIINSKRLEKN